MKKKSLSSIFKLKHAGVLFVALLLIASYTVSSTVRFGLDGSGQLWFGDDNGLIRNSNGKAWTATESNLQSAIWDLNSSGGTVYLPPMSISNPEITIEHDDITLKGTNHGFWQGGGSTIFKADSNTTMITISQANGTIIEGIKFRTMEAYNTTPYHCHAIYIEQTSVVVIRDCGFYYINGSAINIDENVLTPRIINCDFKLCGSSDNATIDVKADSNGCTGLIVTQCTFERDTYIDIRGKNDGYCENAKITQNYFEGGYYSGNAEPSNGFIYGNFHRTLVSQNSFTGDDTDGTCHGIYLLQEGNRITENVLKHIGGYAIYAAGGSLQTIIDSNTIWSCDDTNALSGIYVTNKAVVTNNVIKESGGGSGADAGIELGACSDSVVTGNVIDNCQDIGIYLSGASTSNNIVSGNHIKSCTYGIRYNSANNNTIVDNIFSGNSQNMNYISGSFGDFDNTFDNNIGYNVPTNFIFPRYNNTMPTIPTGYAYFESSTNILRVYNGTAWVSTTLT